MKKIKPMVRLTKEQIQQKQDQIERYIQSVNPADGSLVDSNANVSVKTVATLGAELQKDFSIQLNRKTVADYIQIAWTAGDTLVGPGRGSGVGFYLNYLLDIIQIDPLREKVRTLFWRLGSNGLLFIVI